MRRARMIFALLAAFASAQVEANDGKRYLIIHADDAGMFAEAGVELPKGVGTRTPQEVADGVLRAIEQNRAEVDVAPLSLRLGSIAGLN